MKIKFNYREFKKKLKNDTVENVTDWLVSQYHVDTAICEEFVDDMLELGDKMRKSDTENFADVVCESNKPTREDLEFDEILTVSYPYYKKVNLQKIANSLQNYGMDCAINTLSIDSLRKESEIFLKKFIESGEYERITGDCSFNHSNENIDEKNIEPVENEKIDFTNERSINSLIKNIMLCGIVVTFGVIFIALIKLCFGIGVVKAGDVVFFDGLYIAGTIMCILSFFSFYAQLCRLLPLPNPFIICTFALIFVFLIIILATPVCTWEYIALYGFIINMIHISIICKN